MNTRANQRAKACRLLGVIFYCLAAWMVIAGVVGLCCHSPIFAIFCLMGLMGSIFMAEVKLADAEWFERRGR